jgi:hypothetical protein
MIVFVVLEDDSGWRPSVAGVFATLELAQAFVEGPNGSHCYIDSECGEKVQGEINER